MRLRAAAISMCFVCLGVAGCRDKHGDEAAPEPDSKATPAQLFQVIKTASARQDWAAFFSAFTVESQRRQLSVFLFTLEQKSRQQGPEIHREFRRFLAAHHVEPRAVSAEESDEDLKRRFAGVPSLSAFMAEVIAWADKHESRLPKKDPLELQGYRDLGTAELVDAAPRGDRAILTIRLKDGRAVQMMLRQVGEEWLADVYHK